MKEQIKELYDSGAVATKKTIKDVKIIHTNISPVMHYFRKRKVQVAITLGKFKRGSKILDVGCNMGQYTFGLKKP